MRGVLLFVLTWGIFAGPGHAGAFVADGERAHTEVIAAPAGAYRIVVGGTADMDRTMTRSHGDWKIGFQNNIALEIANTGGVPVRNPRVVLNNRGRWHTNRAMLDEFAGGAKDAQERIYLIWEGLRQNRHHDYPLHGDSEYHDPVRFLNIYGGGFCDDSGMCGSALYHLAGFNAESGGRDPFVRALHGHMMCEVWHGGDYQFMDIDQDVFYLDRECVKPVSGDAVARDHDYARRERTYGPQFQPWDQGPVHAAALFGADDGRSGHGVWDAELSYTLRPGERYVFRWDNRGKYPWGREDTEHRYYGNSRIEYTVPLTAPAPAFVPAVCEGWYASGGALVAAGAESVLEVETETFYALCGGEVSLGARFVPPSAQLTLEARPGQLPYETVWTHEGQRDSLSPSAVDITAALRVHGAPPRKGHSVRLVARNAQGMRLESLRVVTDIYAYPIALPRLRVGENAAVYTQEPAPGSEVTITHRWRESGNVMPPAAPTAPVSPADGAECHSTYVPFRWEEMPGAAGYHLRVSRDPQLRYPYRTNYDVILSETFYEVPYRGMFRPGDTYYWRVRARLANGLWGAWSPTWRFTWKGPMTPRNPRVTMQDGGALVLHWTPNPGGTRPVQYAVYGSGERGFSVHREDREDPRLGLVRGNYLGQTHQTSLVIGGAGMRDVPNANRAYYRVVAVDANGVESCPSDLAETPRPHVYAPAKLPEARVGEPYHCVLHAISSWGDLQFRYEAPGQAYWEREAIAFTLLEGPAWLVVDRDTGALSGAPDTSGDKNVVVGMAVHFPDEVNTSSAKGEAFVKKPKQLRTATRQWVLHIRN